MSTQSPVDWPDAEIPNRQVADAALQFRVTADLLFNHLQEGRCGCVLPLEMIGSFGIELYLKALNSKTVYSAEELDPECYRVTVAPMRKGHSLVGLFDAVDAATRTHLEASYTAHPVVRRAATFREALGQYDNLFVRSRYPFEASQPAVEGTIDGLVRLLDLISDYVTSRQPRLHFRRTDRA
jgi:hypothetical protein